MHVFTDRPIIYTVLLPPRKGLSLTHCFSETAHPSLQVPKNFQRIEVACL